MQPIKRSTGFTLIELMITLGVMAGLAAIAIPAYTGYIETSKEQTTKYNLKQLIIFEDMYFYENDTFKDGVYDPSGPTDTLTAALGWKPEGDKDKYVYTVTACGTGTIAKCFKITVKHVDSTTALDTFERAPVP